MKSVKNLINSKDQNNIKLPYQPTLSEILLRKSRGGCNMRSNEVSPSGIMKYMRRSRMYFMMPRGDTSLLRMLLYKIFSEWWTRKPTRR